MADRDTQNLTLSGLVHDLNNVFQTLVDAADLLQSDPDWQAVAATILRNVEHGQRLVQSVSRATGDTCDLKLVAGSAIDLARDFLNAAHAAEINFQQDIGDDLRLRGTAVSWERVLVNLLLNSAQAMPHGGEVRVAGARLAKGIRITITDDGSGIASDILPRIFDPHFSTKPANSGLGLQIVRSLVQQNGGTVEAANRPSGGAEFVITMLF